MGREALWIFSNRLPSADTGKYASEDQHFTRRETDYLCETCLKAQRVLKTDHFQDVKAQERKSAVSSSHGDMRT
jgi:hypothetical protein